MTTVSTVSPPEDLILHPPRIRLAFLGAVMAGVALLPLLVALASLAQDKIAPLPLVAALCMAGVLGRISYYFLSRLSTPRPSLVIGLPGIYFDASPLVGPGMVRWAELLDASAAERNGSVSLCLELRPDAAFLSSLSTLRRGLLGFPVPGSRARLYLPQGMLPLPVADLLPLLADYRRLAGSGSAVNASPPLQ